MSKIAKGIFFSVVLAMLLCIKNYAYADNINKNITFDKSQNSNEDDKDIAKKLLYALLNKDYEFLLQLSRGKDDDLFFKNGILNEDIKKYLYEDVAPIKSVSNILSSKNILIKIIPQKDENSDRVITILFVPLREAKNLKNSQFLEEKWRKSYFACELIRKDNSYLFYYNLCFAETGGPYH